MVPHAGGISHDIFERTIDEQLTAKLNDAFRNRNKIDSSGGGGGEAGDTTVLFRPSASAVVMLVPGQARPAYRGKWHDTNSLPAQPSARRQLAAALHRQTEACRRDCLLATRKTSALGALGSTWAAPVAKVRCVILLDIRHRGLEASVSVVMGDWG
jgi:hypothetical protein